MSSRSPKADALVLGGEPRVDLLPPEVHQKAKERATRRLLGLLIVLALVMVSGGYGAGALRAAQAQVGLVAAQARTQALLTEKLKYSGATTLTARLAAVSSARHLGASTEILWNTLIGKITSFLPSGVSLVSGTMSAPAPWEPALAAAGPLRVSPVATVGLVLTGGSVDDTSVVIGRLAALPGFADASPDSVVQANGLFTITLTLNLTKEAFSGRFPAASTGALK